MRGNDMFREMRRRKQQVSAGKRVQMIAITPEHMTGKFVYEK